MKYLVKSLLKVQVYNVYQVTIVYIFVHFLKELQKAGEAGLPFTEAMLIFINQALSLYVPNNSVFDYSF